MKSELFKEDSGFECRGILKSNCSLGSRSWLGVGGKANWLYQPADLDDLAEFIRNINDHISYFVLGAGSNLIIRDGGYRGLVIRLGREFSHIDCDNNQVIAGAFAKDSQIAINAAQSGIDLTFLRTIPGTIGGAVKMNAGCYGSYLADHLVRVGIITRNGDLKYLARDELEFSYRSSSIEDDAIVVEVVLKGECGNPDRLMERIESYLDKRNRTQPTGLKTAGSTFRNPVGYSSTFDQDDDTELLAWKLIDKAGMRGMRKGDAQISEKHPNFLLNLGNATASQIENLGEMVRRVVYQQSGTMLEWEVKRIGELAHPKIHEGRQG
ncbi:MAG: UDP-N-acetylmuramate dehydrogenase [Rhodobacteraceae bacterium]|nr:UDP-N-acetylmuramate dehydrogenase [Paracoccaceae bacterium]